MFDVDVAMAAWMGDRFGVASRSELKKLGLSDKQIDRRLSGGLLERIHCDVYRHLASVPASEAQIRAAVLAGGPMAWASGRSAMQLYGTRGRWDGQPEITILGCEWPDVSGVDVRRIDRIATQDHTHRFGIPVLAPPLALLLLGASESDRRVHVAVHDLVFQRLTARRHLVDVLTRYGGRGRRGTTKFRKAVRSLDRDGRASQTNLELDLLRLLAIHDLPTPQLQLPVLDADGMTRKLDLGFSEQMLDVETDGDRWHLNLYDRAADRRRDRALEAIGWDVQRYGSNDVHVDPGAMLARIRSSLLSDANAA
jgi:very-short-patch-repair endonuclease